MSVRHTPSLILLLLLFISHLFSPQLLFNIHLPVFLAFDLTSVVVSCVFASEEELHSEVFDRLSITFRKIAQETISRLLKNNFSKM